MTTPSSLNTNHCIAVHDLVCVRGERELFRNINFSLYAGQCLHVIGANGSGKSSLLRILCGLLPSDSGQTLWDNNPIQGNTDYISNFAYLGHKDALKNELTTVENLTFYQSCDTAPNDTQIDEILAKLGILKCAELLTQQLSFGQRRRLSFARLLVNDYPLWIVDEPFTGIDHDGREVIEQLCVNHLSQNGMIVLTNHQSLRESRLKPYLTELNLVISDKQPGVNMNKRTR